LFPPVESSSIGRIIGGEECVPHSEPWQAALYYFDKFICGGILINETWILTAAHCKMSNIQICLGDHNRMVHEGTEQWRHAVKMCIHPSFNSITYDNDIMLLKMNSPVVINDYVKLITLPTEPVADNTICNISGWGSTISPGDKAKKGSMVTRDELRVRVELMFYSNIGCSQVRRTANNLGCSRQIRMPRNTL
ncbi:hypothetical protein AB205_0010890, partial [Aquarana catesbeiana]